jgi:hypothetical protein
MRFDILLRRLHPTLKWFISDGNVNDYDKIQWMDENTPLPTREEFENEWIKYIKEHDLEFVRSKRNAILSQTDYLATIDYPHPTEESKQAWLDYRQALRDLPANTTDPENPVWPTPPE